LRFDKRSRAVFMTTELGYAQWLQRAIWHLPRGILMHRRDCKLL
jgi:hypothetical protein